MAESDSNEAALTHPATQIEAHLQGQRRRTYSRFTLAALSSIPWVGGFLAATAALDAEKEQGRVNDFQRQWMEEHRSKIEELGKTLAQIIERIDGFGEEVRQRLESPEYLTLVRKAFRIWDQADTQEKRDLIRKLLTNACATKLCPDDLVRLFLDWINTYHEAHFRVIREIYKHPGATRADIWKAVGTERPREDSAEADVYKLLIRDLSMGSVARQRRETDGAGRFYRKDSGERGTGSSYMKSAFDDTEPYELTELGRQFVHYTMSEVVPRIDGGSDGSQPSPLPYGSSAAGSPSGEA